MDKIISDKYEERIRLWNQSFGDREDYIERFLCEHENRSIFVSNNKGGRLVSAMYLLPAILQVRGKAYECQYIYAVATLKEERGKGYCEEMLKGIESKYPDMMTFLVPADERLIKYYELRGYRLLHSGSLGKYRKLYNRDVELFESGMEYDRYYEQRNNLLKDENCIMWSREELSYIYKTSSTPQYPSLMVNRAMYCFLSDMDIEDIYFNFAME